MKIRNLVLAMTATLAALPVLAADIDGKWNAVIDSEMGSISQVFELKAEGEKLTGNMSMDFGGQPVPPMAISEGVVKGTDVSFKISFQFMPDAPPIVAVYKAKLKGDELDVVSTVPDMGQGPVETKFVAKRAK